MKYNDLEKHFQQQLGGHEVPMNTDLLVADLFGKEKRKNPLFFWLAGIMAVLMAALTFYMWKAKTQKEQDVRFKTEIQKVKAASINNIEKAEQASVALASINVSKTEKQQSMDNISGDQIVPANTFSENNSSTKKYSLKVNSEPKTSVNNMALLRNNEATKRSAKVVENKNTKQKTDKGQILTTPEKVQSVKSTKQDETVLSKLEPAKTLVISDYSLDHYNQLLPGVKCPTFKKKKQWVFSIIPEVGYFYPLTSFQYNNNAEVLGLRKNNESTLEGLQAALYGKISHKRRPWYLKSGINYDRITRKMDLNQSFTKSDTTIGIISITESQNGDTITVIRGPIVTETNIIRREVRHYYHHLWSIPLTVGFQQHNDYFEWGVEAGVSFNLSSKQTGYVMTTADDFGSISAAGLYKRKIGLSYLAQVQLGLPFSERSVLALAIRANINPNNYATNASFIDEKYQMLGAHLMYEFKF